MSIDVVVDPGHGGAANAGRSTAYGARGPTGVLEKDVTLRLARAVAERLGRRAVLTRADDRNLSLGERASIARDAGARVFLSIHANAGPGEARGPETWVHSRGSPASSALADRVQRELARLGGRNRGIRRGDLAVLHPEHHAWSTAACLVEVDFLDDPEGERRLRDPRGVDSMADALATAALRFIDGADPTYGRAAALPRGAGRLARGLDDPLMGFDATRFVVLGDDFTGPPSGRNQIRQSEMTDVQNGWRCMNGGTGMRLHGSAADLSTFRGMLLDGLVESPALRRRFVRMACDAAHAVRYEIGRGAGPTPPLLAGVFFDAFEFDAAAASAAAATPVRRVHTFDITDIGACPRTGRGGADVPTQAERLAHGLAEAYHAANSASTGTTAADFTARYAVAHPEGIRAENEVRNDLGFTNSRRPSGGDAITATTLDRDYVDAGGAVTVFHFDVDWPHTNVTGVHR